MNTPTNEIKNWQDWLAEFQRIASTSGWLDFMDISDDDEIPLRQWAAVYMIPVQTTLSKAMLLACLQAPPAETDAALAAIAKAGSAVHFGKPPRSLKRDQRAVYQESTRYIVRSLPSTAELLLSVFTHYVRGEYDMQVDANLLMRDALTQCNTRDRSAALVSIGKAGAAALRGSGIWNGWADEGPDEFRHWGLSLTTMLDGFRSLQPLGDLAEERARCAERAAALSTKRQVDEPAAVIDDELIEAGPSEEFAAEFAAILENEEPLTDAEIQALGHSYQLFGEAAVRALELVDVIPEADGVDRDDVISMSVEMLGVLRYGESQAINLLVDIIVSQDELMDDTLVSMAIWSLQQMGPAVLKTALDFARYSSLDKPRSDMLTVLAVAGRGSDEVFDYLAKLFNDTPWANSRTRYASPLALTHDARAVPLIVEALRSPAVTENDAWLLLDALQELEVTFFINADTRAVDIPGHGVIDDVLPADWHTRLELAEQAEAEDEWEDDWDEDDDDDSDESDDDEDFQEVVYDKEGIPRCPDCGSELHYIAGRWEHTPPSVAPTRPAEVKR